MARLAMRAGAHEVHVFFPGNIAQLPVMERERTEALKEGIAFHPHLPIEGILSRKMSMYRDYGVNARAGKRLKMSTGERSYVFREAIVGMMLILSLLLSVRLQICPSCLQSGGISGEMWRAMSLCCQVFTSLVML